MQDGGWVVDASVVAKWYLRDEEGVSQADRLMNRYVDGQAYLTTPQLARYELANAVYWASRRGRMDEATARAAVTAFDELGLAQAKDDDTRLNASIRLARQFRISFYDALYLALAEELRLRMVTADAALHERVAQDMPQVMLIQEFPA